MSYITFVDFSKAYDCVNRELLWDKLEPLGVNGRMLLAIQSIYKDVKYCVRVNGLQSKWFDVSIRLHQGCLLSLMLFNLYINDLASEMKELNVGVMIGGGKKV